MNKQPEIKLSIIILSYNVKNKLLACLDSVYKYKASDYEVIVVDNKSPDNSLLAVRQKKYPGIKLYQTGSNLGFAGGNNFGVKKAIGEYIVFLNPDTVIEKNSFTVALDFLIKHPIFGAVTVKVELPDGKLDYSCRRGFPTPWNALCFFSGLTKIFPKVKLFSGYTLGYVDQNFEHEVDAITGAFFMLPRSLGEKLGWFDTNFFWNGEDLDFCYRIKEAGYKIMYLPQAKIIHFKGSSGGHKRGSKTFHARFDVMELFYEKHYKNKYSPWLKRIVLLGIEVRKLITYVGL